MASTPSLKIGVLGIQGAVSEHVDTTNLVLKHAGLDGYAVVVKKQTQLKDVQALIIPGGESTAIGRLSKERGLFDEIARLAEEGLPIFGTCAGAILLAKEVFDAKIGKSNQPLIGLINMKVIRNAFGRQRESFEAEVDVSVFPEKRFPGVFIRAPIIEKVWGEAVVSARYEDKIVGVQQGNLLATVFHPELSQDLRFHQYFIKKSIQSPFLKRQVSS